MDERQLVRTIELENGLTLKIFDISKKIAGDRWYVGIILRIEIPVSILADRSGSLPASADDIRNAFGETVYHEQKRDRNFIDADKKIRVFDELEKSFTDSVFPYLSHPDFALRCVQKKYKEYSDNKMVEYGQRAADMRRMTDP